MADFSVQSETVTAYFNGLAKRDMFDEVVVIGRFKSDAISEDKEDGYVYYVAASGSSPKAVKLIKEATAEWDLD